MLVAGWLDRTAAASARAAGPSITTVEILVAKVDLKPGDIATADRLRWQKWPLSAVQENYMVNGRTEAAEYRDAMVRFAIAGGEPVVAARLVRRGDHGVMAALIAPGRRAISIPVTAASGLAGFISPGDRVDIILTANLRQDGRIISRTVAENVRVLAIDQRADPISMERLATGEDKLATPSTVTLEILPRQAEQLAAAQELGRLSLALRDLGAQRQTPGAVADMTRPDKGFTLLPTFDGQTLAPPALDAAAAALAQTPVPHARPAAPRAGGDVEVVRGGRSAAARVAAQS